MGLFICVHDTFYHIGMEELYRPQTKGHILFITSDPQKKTHPCYMYCKILNSSIRSVTINLYLCY